MTAPAQSHHLVVDDTWAGMRLDAYLTRALPDLSRARLQRLIRATLVLVDGCPAKSSLVVATGMRVDVNVPAVARATPGAEAIPLTRLHDDDDIVVVEKPAGLVVHPGAGHATGTLVNALLHHVRGLSGIGGQERPGIVHRLDRGTSGVMVVAKHDRAHEQLSAQFRDRTVEKEYLALVWGRPPVGLEMSGAIGRDPAHRQRMSGRARRGRAARTRVASVEAIDGVSLVRIRIDTGRTHQIRVHLSEAGFPVVGDDLYGGTRTRVPAGLAAVRRLGRPFLHAARLTFQHPGSGDRMTFESALPFDLADVLASIRRAARPPAADSPQGDDL